MERLEKKLERLTDMMLNIQQEKNKNEDNLPQRVYIQRISKKRPPMNNYNRFNNRFNNKFRNFNSLIITTILMIIIIITYRIKKTRNTTTKKFSIQKSTRSKEERKYTGDKEKGLNKRYNFLMILKYHNFNNF